MGQPSALELVLVFSLCSTLGSVYVHMRAFQGRCLLHLVCALMLMIDSCLARSTTWLCERSEDNTVQAEIAVVDCKLQVINTGVHPKVPRETVTTFCNLGNAMRFMSGQ